MSAIHKTPIMPPVSAAVLQKQEAPRDAQQTPVKFEIANPVNASKETQEARKEDALQKKSEHFFRPAPQTEGNLTVTQELDASGRVVEQMPARKIVEAYTPKEA